MSKKPNYVFDTDDVLCHYGIPNQKWGHRRFQNEDGSLTPEGRERYGVGDRLRNFFKIRKSDQQIKADEQKAKAKISYNTQKYKADLKSKAQKEKDARAAEEERNRLKEQAKTEKMLKKEQGKIDRTAQKERNKTEQDGRPLGMKFTRTRKMSDEDLQKAVDRLKLQAEYNKQYVLATQPNGALAKADRFFEGPTGKAVLDLSKAVLPAVATAATNKILDSSLKYHNKLDREKAEAEIEKNKASAERERALARSNDATAESTRSKTEQERLDSIQNRKIAATNAQNEVEKMRFEELRTQDKHEREQRRFDAESASKIKTEKAKALSNAMESRSKVLDQRQARELEKLEKLGGIKYVDNRGVTYTTQGSLAIKDQNDQLDYIYGRKDREYKDRVAQNEANKKINDMHIDTRSKAAQAEQQRALADQQKAIAKAAKEQAQMLKDQRMQQRATQIANEVKAMEAKGYTQEEMADRLGVSTYTIKKYLL